MAKKKNNTNLDSSLLMEAGFADLPSALAAIDSITEEMNQCEIDYEILVDKMIRVEDQIIGLREVIVEQAIEISRLRSLKVCGDCG